MSLLQCPASAHGLVPTPPTPMTASPLESKSGQASASGRPRLVCDGGSLSPCGASRKGARCRAVNTVEPGAAWSAPFLWAGHPAVCGCLSPPWQTLASSAVIYQQLLPVSLPVLQDTTGRIHWRGRRQIKCTDLDADSFLNGEETLHAAWIPSTILPHSNEEKTLLFPLHCTLGRARNLTLKP